MVGVSRDSPMVLQDWMLDPMMEEKENTSVKFPIISCMSLDSGLLQAVEVPLDKGYPIPTIIRVVSAIKMVDNAKGSQFAPASSTPRMGSSSTTRRSTRGR